MNFNNMNPDGTGDCDRNKLGQLLVANIAALLNKKNVSDSESESVKSEEKRVIESRGVVDLSGSERVSGDDVITTTTKNEVNSILQEIKDKIDMTMEFSIDEGTSIQDILNAATPLMKILE